MNEQLSSCLWLLVHCSFVHCLHYVLWYNRFSFPAQSLASLDSAPVLPTVMVFAVAHPLMSKFLTSALPQLSALCCFECLSCPLPCQYGLSVFPSNGCDVNIGLLLPWPTMHFQTHPSLSPLTIMTGCCDDDFLLSCASASRLLRLWHPTLPHVLYRLATACPCAVYGWLCFGERCSSPKFGLLADRYHFCEKCFNEIQGETVSLGDDPTQPQAWVLACSFILKHGLKMFSHACKMFIFTEEAGHTCVQMLRLWFVPFSTVVMQLIRIVLIDFRSIHKDQFEKKKNDTLDPELWVVIS